MEENKVKDGKKKLPKNYFIRRSSPPGRQQKNYFVFFSRIENQLPNKHTELRIVTTK